MTAYDLSEVKMMILKEESYLKSECDQNNTETVLLTNKEVEHILDLFSACRTVIDEALRRR